MLITWFFQTSRVQHSSEESFPAAATQNKKSTSSFLEHAVVDDSSSSHTNAKERLESKPSASVQEKEKQDPASEAKQAESVFSRNENAGKQNTEHVRQQHVSSDVQDPKNSKKEEQDFLEDLFAQVNRAEFQQNHGLALEILLSIKDKAQGEDLHSVLKKLNNYAAYGANEEILEVFFSSQTLPEADRFRVLSYVNPEYLLEPETVAQLDSEYDHAEEKELRHSILNTLAEAGGDEGIERVIERAENSSEYFEWKNCIAALERSQSQSAYVYLHDLLDTLVQGNQGDVEEEISVVKEAIYSLRQ